MVGARLPRGTRLFFGRNGSDHLRSEPFRPLHQQQSDSAGSGMDQHRISVFYFPEIMEQVVRGHPLQRERGPFLERKDPGAAGSGAKP